MNTQIQLVEMPPRIREAIRNRLGVTPIVVIVVSEEQDYLLHEQLGASQIYAQNTEKLRVAVEAEPFLVIEAPLSILNAVRGRLGVTLDTMLILAEGQSYFLYRSGAIFIEYENAVDVLVLAADYSCAKYPINIGRCMLYTKQSRTNVWMPTGVPCPSVIFPSPCRKIPSVEIDDLKGGRKPRFVRVSVARDDG